MKIYTLSPQGISKIRKQFLQRVNIILGVACCVVIAISLWNATDNNRLMTLIISILFSAAMMIFGPSRALQQNKEIWESIRIEIGDDYVARSQMRIPQVRINRQEITSIDEIGAGLCIRTADKSHTLVIPNHLDTSDYEEIKEKLASWSTIQLESPKTNQQNTLLIIVLLAGIGILFLSQSFWVVLITGVLMTGYYAYAYWSLRRAEGIDPQFKRSMLFAVLLSLFITIIKVWFLPRGF